MGKSVIIVLFYIGFGFCDFCSGLPIDFTTVGTGKLNAIWLTSSLLLAVGFLIGIVSLIIGCICCRNGRGFQQNEAKPVEEFSNSHGCLANPVGDGFVNPTASSEITIFPPFGLASDASNRSSIVNFEPLPNIKPQGPNLRPAAFSYSEQEISSQDWFYNPYSNFPRNQLKYLQEFGKGWFGRVVEGEAQNIVPNEKVTKVIVKILHEDATPTDQMYFLHEVKYYRDLKHPNILGLLGRCLETEPFLILLESCPNGDLKSFLTQNMASAQALVEQGVTLRMCYNITSGLQFMHENKFIHTDLAARNCLVTPDLTVKIGDYGNSIEVFKSDYYCAGSVALPVRWCAPETLKCTDVTIETREVTPLANIWTLAIVFWEICEFCKLPYEELNDDQVIVRVLGEKNYYLQTPKMLCLYKDELYHLMKLCWSPPLQRPTAAQIGVILANLLSSKNGDKDQIDPRRLSQDFEQRWQKSKPNYIPKTDNATDSDDVTQSVTSATKFKGAKVADSSYLDSPLGVFMQNKGKGQESPRVCLKSDVKGDKPCSAVQHSDSDGVESKSSNYEPEDGYFDGVKKSDSVTNLTGSLDRLNTVAQELQEKEFKADFDLKAEVKPPRALNSDQQSGNPEIDSWLKGVEVNNEEDETFVRKISEAIRDLDAALAMEKTSSSEETSGKSSHQSSPGKETKEEPVVVDFKLGGDTTSFINFIPKTFELSSLQNSEEPHSINFTNSVSDKPDLENYGQNNFANALNSMKFKTALFPDESLKGNDSFLNVHSRNSSDTEDEIWRRRIERGEFSEKVKEKSKSIANLMVLTHIDASDESDADADRSFDRSLTRGSYSRRHCTNSKTFLPSNNFGSENDLTNAVLEDNFKESLKKLSNDHKEYGRFDSLGMILPTSVDRHNLWGNILKKSSSEENLINAMSSIAIESSLPTMVEDAKLRTDPSEVLENKRDNSISSDNFLGNTASKKLGSDVMDVEVNAKNSASLDNKTNTLDIKVDSVSEGIRKLENTPFCDNSEIGSECKNTLFNGSSPVYDNYGSNKFDKIAADEDLTVGVTENSESISVEDSAEENGIKSEEYINEDTILEVTENHANDVPDIVPIFFGAGNQFAALQNGGEVKEKEKDETVVAENNSPVKTTENESAAAVDHNLIPEIKITEDQQPSCLEDDVEDVVYQVGKVRPFKFVLKDDESMKDVSATIVNHYLIPEIKITEDQQPNSLEDDVEDVVYQVGKVRPFKFVLKDVVESLVKNDSGEKREMTVAEKIPEPNDEMIVRDQLAENMAIKNVRIMEDLIMNKDRDFNSSEIFNEKGKSLEKNGGVEVIIGACEDYTLDYFKGLKTTFGSVEGDVPNEKIFQNASEVGINKEVNLDVWDKHLEKSITQIFDNANFDDINFFGSSLESSGKDVYSDMQVMVSDNSVSTSPNTSLSNMESDEQTMKEKKSDDPLHSSGFTTLNGNASEEEYENSKLRTPDDERSSDSGFRDKGSLSESVEDGCEGKYNLEDIEAELEEAYVKGAFNNCNVVKEKSPPTSQPSTGFEYEEAKFYEDENKNEDDLSDLDGEIEFWQNQENSDYYPEISEFNPTSSHGWYLHPPDENFFVSNDSIDEEFVNALRNELRQKLPVQSRSFHEFSENYDNVAPCENTEDERKYTTNISGPLSPILEEQDHTSSYATEQIYFPSQDNAVQKGRKNIMSIMESGKSVDTNAFIHYLDYMVETEGKDKNIDNFAENYDGFFSKDLIEKNQSETREDILGGRLDRQGLSKDPKSGDILVVNMKTNEVKLVGSAERERNGEVETDTDQGMPDEEGLIFTPESATPERDRSLSDPSRSSNGSRIGDISSPDVTISSPDVLSECYLTPTSEKSPVESPEHVKSNIEVSIEDQTEVMKFASAECSEESQQLERVDSNPRVDLSEGELSENGDNCDYGNAFEMSTSFMGEASDDDDGESPEQTGVKVPENSDANTNDWESLSSGGEEEVSTSSGEFIWKDGDKESRVKVKHVSDHGREELLFQETQETGEDWKDGEIQNGEAKEDCADADNCDRNVDDMSVDENEDGNTDFSDSDDDPDCSSTGSSASITDFVPSAWNSKATPSRPALRSPDKKSENQKRRVWFKKQKYHCIYEYPREPSDTESANNSPQKHFTYGIDPTDVSNKYFTYGINSKMNLTNKYFAYGLSDLIDYSNYVDWEALDGVEPDAVTEDSENGAKPTGNNSGSDDRNFYNLNSFDYDFNGSSLSNDEFFVSSSARPFQGGSSQFFPSSSRFPVFKNDAKTPTTAIGDDDKDFITPDSGLEDSRTTTPQIKPEASTAGLSPETNNSNGEVVNVFDNLKFNFINTGTAPTKAVSDAFGEDSSSSNDLSVPSTPTPLTLGELRHTRDKLKLDLPLNHNIDLDIALGKNVNKMEELTPN